MSCHEASCRIRPDKKKTILIKYKNMHHNEKKTLRTQEIGVETKVYNN